MSYYGTNGLKNNKKKTNRNKNSKNIDVTINTVITELTTTLFASGFLPTASATRDDSIPIPIPRPKKAKPNIIPIAYNVAA